MNTPKQLTIEHLAAYLPYGVKVVPIFGGYAILDVENIGRVLVSDKPIKPVLRPLSDLIKTITHNGETFVPIDVIFKLRQGYTDWLTFEKESWIKKHGTSGFIGRVPHSIIKMLHSWHFDTFGLIEAGLAIDINTLNNA